MTDVLVHSHNFLSCTLGRRALLIFLIGRNDTQILFTMAFFLIYNLKWKCVYLDTSGNNCK